MQTQEQSHPFIHKLTPLEPHEVISNETLHRLALGGPERAMGEISDIDQAILALTLPDICGELLALRMAQELAEKPTPSPQPQSLTERLRAVTGRSSRPVTA